MPTDSYGLVVVWDSLTASLGQGIPFTERRKNCALSIDVAYPSDNAGLMEQIAESGAIVSERPLGAVPQARHFPRRNRLISGLTLGVVVVEAAYVGAGTTGHTTAKISLLQGTRLSTIAAKQSVNGGWQTLYQLNKGVVANPNLIFPGQKIRIPK